MASLRTLLNKRSTQTDVPFQDGEVTTFIPWKMTAQSYCWKSPGTGVAVIEVWGAGGGGAGGQCCGGGIPGNSGAYSRAVVNVNSSGFVCGTVGGSPTAASSCIGCRGCCSFACIAPLGSLTRVMRSEGGHGGFWMCQTGQGHYTCFIVNGWCGSNPFGYAGGCGFICNLGVTTLGQGTITVACACGGDVNVPGGFSITDMNTCNTPESVSASIFYHSYPAGLRSCQPGRVRVCYCDTSAGKFTRGEAAFELAYTSLDGMAVSTRAWAFCCSQYIDCGCYPPGQCNTTNGVTGAGYGSIAGLSGGETNPTCGSRGGPGLVKITFIS